MLLIGTMPSEKDQYKENNFAVHSSKLRLHKRQADPGPHLDPCLLPQFSPEEEAEVRYHAYSWICGSNLAHIPPPQKPTLPLCQLWAPETEAQEAKETEEAEEVEEGEAEPDYLQLKKVVGATAPSSPRSDLDLDHLVTSALAYNPLSI